MEIVPIESGPLMTNCYIVYDDFTRNAVLIDAPPDCTPAVMKIAEERDLVIDAVFLTHSHWDHTMDAALIKEKTGAPVYVHKDDEYRMLEPMKHTMMQLPFDIEPFKPDNYFKHNDNIYCGDIILQVRHTPGHTEGGVCFVEHGRKVVFAGDTILRESIGRVDLPGGDFGTIIKSINELIFTLPGDFKIFPGHGPATTVGHEVENNPFFGSPLI